MGADAGFSCPHRTADTRSGAFHGVSGDQTKPLMHRQGKMSYAETNSFQAVDLPYGDSAFTMSVVLPKPGNTVEAVAASLTPDAWRSLGASYHTQLVDLTLPCAVTPLVAAPSTRGTCPR